MPNFKSIRGPEDIAERFVNAHKLKLRKSFFHGYPLPIPGILGIYFVGRASPWYENDGRPLWIGSGQHLEKRRLDLLHLFDLSNLDCDDFRIKRVAIDPHDPAREMWTGGSKMLINLYAPEWSTTLRGIASHAKGNPRNGVEPKSAWAQRHIPDLYAAAMAGKGAYVSKMLALPAPDKSKLN